MDGFPTPARRLILLDVPPDLVHGITVDIGVEGLDIQ